MLTHVGLGDQHEGEPDGTDQEQRAHTAVLRGQADDAVPGDRDGAEHHPHPAVRARAVPRVPTPDPDLPREAGHGVEPGGQPGVLRRVRERGQVAKAVPGRVPRAAARLGV